MNYKKVMEKSGWKGRVAVLDSKLKARVTCSFCRIRHAKMLVYYVTGFVH